MTDLERRLRDKMAVADSGCWLWLGGTNGRYGQMSVEGRDQYVHRLAYELWVGPISEGLTIDHLCATKLCINPKHLEPVPNAVNIQRAAAALTHCMNGHPYTEANTYRRPKGRQCKECGLIRKREARRAGRA